MILLTHETPILLGIAPADFRKSLDGFVSLCQYGLLQEPRNGTVFVFINRAKTMIRALSYDGTGYWLMSKRLSRGKFTGWPDRQCALSVTSARELRIILSGGPWTSPESAAPASTLRKTVLASAQKSVTTTHNAS